MIADGPRVCPWCSTVLEFAGGHLVDIRGPEESCEGCKRWIDILERANWPNVKRYGDIKRVRYPAHVDIICGGFPCQDISHAGRGAGISGKRSGLWRSMARAIRVVRPRYALVENVAALLGRGMGRVCGDLAESGYDAEWDCIPASAVGAPHRRDRVWIVAHANPERLQKRRLHAEQRAEVSDTAGRGRRHQALADPVRDGLERSVPARNRESSCGRIFARSSTTRAGFQGGAEQWRIEPDVGRVAHGVPPDVDRLGSLGNSIVPQVAEWLFRRIVEADAMRETA